MPTLITEAGVGTDLELAVVGGRPRFPAVWLRDNCPCPECVAPGTGQKLKDITDMPNGLAITLTEDAGEFVVVTRTPVPFGYVDGLASTLAVLQRGETR